MAFRWLKRTQSNTLILYFSGWSMDGSEVAHLAMANADVLVVYDYTEPINAAQIETFTAEYVQVHLVAWSFGVWAAAEVLSPSQLSLASATAINGTLQPIDESKGIPPAVFDATLHSLTPENLTRFQRRMCQGPQARQHLQTALPKRDFDNQFWELARLGERMRQATRTFDLFDHVLIGRSDRIFPAQAQTTAWTGYPMQTLEAGHYPFNLWTHWQELWTKH